MRYRYKAATCCSEIEELAKNARSCFMNLLAVLRLLSSFYSHLALKKTELCSIMGAIKTIRSTVVQKRGV